MSSQTIYVIKCPDSLIIRAFQQACSKAEGMRATFADLTGQNLDDATLADLLSEKGPSYFVQNATLAASVGSWTYSRLSQNSNNPEAARFDLLSINYSSPVQDRRAIIRIQSSILRNLGDPLGKVSEPDSLRTNLEPHRAILISLENSLARMMGELTDSRSRLESEFAERSKRLDDDLREQRVQQEREIVELKRVALEAIDTRARALEERASEIATREKLLDDRNNTHARRDIRDRITNAIQGRLKDFKASDEVRRLRLGVHITSIVMILSAIAGSVYSFLQASELISLGQPVELNLLVLAFSKTTILGAVAVGLAIWYLRWINAWFHQNAEAEATLRQLTLDIERASWVVETMLEWRAKGEQRAIPTALLNALVGNLFTPSANNPLHPRTPAEDLAGLLFGSASRLTLRSQAGDVELDRRGLKSYSSKRTKKQG